MSGNVSSSEESPSLLWQVASQWRLWIVAILATGLSVIMATRTEETVFHEVWFGLLAVGSVLYALRRIEGLSVFS